MGSSGMGHSVPIAAVIDGTAFNENNEEVPIVEEIDYQEFFEVSTEPHRTVARDEAGLPKELLVL